MDNNKVRVVRDRIRRQVEEGGEITLRTNDARLILEVFNLRLKDADYKNEYYQLKSKAKKKQKYEEQKAKREAERDKKKEQV